MNHSPEKVIHYLTGQKSLEEVTLEELQKQADEHPYFPVSQFLLAKKLNIENSSGFISQIQKTAITFSNPLWLRYQMMNDFSAPIPRHKQGAENKENYYKPSNEVDDVIIKEPNPLPEDFSHSDTNNLVNQPAFEQEDKDDVLDFPIEERTDNGQTINENKDSDIDKVISENNHQANREIPLEEKNVINQPEEEMAILTRDTDETTDEFLEELTKSQDTVERGTETLDEDPMELLPQTQVKHVPQLENGEMDEHERMFQNIKAMLDATSEEADTDTQSTIIPIDPYYTIDYFASQGIKLDLNRPQDQLGTQVKKFTQWLRHMKKLGPEDATEVIYRTEAESDIQQIADTSNIAREVVTEAMALVLEKQGKKDKAIVLYNKLSFLNPHKSAYFADKIKNLKGI